MNIGILGTGFGAHHANLCRQLEEIDEIFVFGRSTEKLNMLREKTGVHTTTDINDILDNKNISLIDVCLPSALHREYVIKALTNGKHVFCETPVALSMEDAHAMVSAERQYKKRVFVDLFLRFESPYRYLYNVNKSAQYGKLLFFRIERKTPPIWGPLGADRIATNLMIHDIDFTYWLLGKPKAVRSFCASSGPEQCAVTAVFHYVGTMAEITGSSAMAKAFPFPVSYEAVFEKAVIKYGEDVYIGSSSLPETIFKLYTDEGSADIEVSQNISCLDAIKHAVSCIRNGDTGLNTLNEAAKSLELALKIKKQIIV